MAEFEDVLKDLDEQAKNRLLDHLIKGLNVESKKDLSDNLLKVTTTKDEDQQSKDNEVCSYDDRKLPSLPKFSGTNAKGETTYQRWKFEVNELRQSGCPEAKLKRAIQKSLFGLAADNFMYLGKESHVTSILTKFDALYMTTDDDESALAQFYSATQHKDETLPAWFTRLKSMLNADCLSLSQEQKDKMLRSRFWKGLACDTTKNALRHKFDNGSPAMELLQAARQIVEENKSKSAQCNISQVNRGSSQQDVLSKLMEKMSTMQNRVDELDSQIKNNSRQVSSQPTMRNNLGQSSQPAMGHNLGHPSPQTSQSTRTSQFNGTCFKCKRFGHKASFCRAKPRNAHLNSAVPVQGGHMVQQENPPHLQQR